MIYPEVKFLSSCEPVKSDKLCFSKMQWKAQNRDSYFKREKLEKGRGNGSQPGPKPSKTIPLDVKSQE